MNQYIKESVNRFLGWKLPADFAPDAGITFKRLANADSPIELQYKHEPIGTNLFNDPQAEAMLLHVAAPLLDRITELEAQLAAAWIPVSQRLPVEGESVFVFSKYGQSDLADFIGGAFENCWLIDDADETITHWIGKPPYPPIIGRASQ